jgi:hypothetical protein
MATKTQATPPAAPAASETSPATALASTGLLSPDNPPQPDPMRAIVIETMLANSGSDR